MDDPDLAEIVSRWPSLPQPDEDRDDENNNSIGLRVQHGDAAAFLGGDSEDDERWFWRGDAGARTLCAGCDVLQLAHHGSHNGTDDAWLDLVRPELAVAMCGLNNPFGHPHRATLDRLAVRRISLKRTDLDGPVLIASDGRKWSLAAKGAGEVVATSPASPGSRTKAAAPDGGKVDLNTATVQELEALPGIGPVLAKRIVAARPFATVDDLDAVPGIGPKKMALLRPAVTVRRSRAGVASGDQP